MLKAGSLGELLILHCLAEVAKDVANTMLLHEISGTGRQGVSRRSHVALEKLAKLPWTI
jgi:hypothetical protein